jgi:hypothetical protein
MKIPIDTFPVRFPSGRFIALAALALLTGSALLAQFSIDWHTIDGGGGTSSGGVFSVSGTVGQADAGVKMTGGPFSISGGYWAAATAIQTPGAPVLSIANAGPGQVTLSWTPDGPGFVLQESTTLAPGSWTDVPGDLQNPVTLPTVGRKFFRLSYQP